MTDDGSAPDLSFDSRGRRRAGEIDLDNRPMPISRRIEFEDATDDEREAEPS